MTVPLHLNVPLAGQEFPPVSSRPSATIPGADTPAITRPERAPASTAADLDRRPRAAPNARGPSRSRAAPQAITQQTVQYARCSTHHALETMQDHCSESLNQ